jgi:hypothetical protein
MIMVTVMAVTVIVPIMPVVIAVVGKHDASGKPAGHANEQSDVE